MRKPTKKEQALMDELEQVINEKVRIETRLDESLKIYAELDMVLQSHRLTTQIFSQN